MSSFIPSTVVVSTIASRPEQLDDVRTLGRLHRATLGFFPDGAFDDAAKRGHILVATDGRGLLGYLLYRVTARYNEASVVHLCVGEGARGRGVARALVDHLKVATSHLLGVRLLCREDYEASNVWPKLGFTFEGQRPGRSRAGTPLMIWRIEHNLPPLVRLIRARSVDARPAAALDASVFFDLLDGEAAGRLESPASLALQADWLQDEISLAVTTELRNEIARAPAARRTQALAFMRSFDELRADEGAVADALRALEDKLGPPSSDNDRSDRVHLAHASACGARWFVTRDSGILKVAEVVEDLLGVQAYHPADLVAHLDQTLNQLAYAPSRAAGTLFTWRRLGDGDRGGIQERFLDYRARERSAPFRDLLATWTANPRRFDSQVLRDSDGTAVALVVIDASGPDRLEIAQLRIQVSRPGDRAPVAVAETLAHQIVRDVINKASQAGTSLVAFPAALVPPCCATALQAAGFVLHGDDWIKPIVPVVGPAGWFLAHLGEIAKLQPHRESEGTGEERRPAVQSAVANADDLSLHRLAWPGRLVEDGSQAVLMPIQPHWAEHLFDEDLARQALFGSDHRLMFNVENVYYRSRSGPRFPLPPFHILWYVSTADHRAVQQIRAISVAEEVVIAPPRDLFRRFSRFGVYRWEHVLGTAKGDLANGVMAIRFSLTSALPAPLPLSAFRELRDWKQGAQLPGPVLLTSAELRTLLSQAGLEVIQ